MSTSTGAVLLKMALTMRSLGFFEFGGYPSLGKLPIDDDDGDDNNNQLIRLARGCVWSFSSKPLRQFPSFRFRRARAPTAGIGGFHEQTQTTTRHDAGPVSACTAERMIMERNQGTTSDHPFSNNFKRVTACRRRIHETTE